MKLLNHEGKELVGKLLPDEIRMLDALSKLDKDQHAAGIVEGIHKHTGKKRDELLDLIESLVKSLYLGRRFYL